MPKSRGPPYTDPPSATYIVVIRPWSVASPPKRTQQDYDRVGTWIAYILWDATGRGASAPSIESIYRMKTRDEMIVQLPLGTDISPLLGEHHWPSFVKGWKNHSGAANRNWEEFFPNILPLHSVPIKSPYPYPSWAKLPSTLSSFALPIPQGHFAVAIEHEHEHEPIKLSEKCDSYKLEEDAKGLLSSLKPEPDDCKSGIIKIENDQSGMVPKTETTLGHAFADKDYQPSAELLAAFSTLNQSVQPTASDFPTTDTSHDQNDEVKTIPHSVDKSAKAMSYTALKREISQESIVVGKKRIKVEES